MNEKREELTCPTCHSHFIIFFKHTIKYCPHCKALLHPFDDSTQNIFEAPSTANAIIQEHLPKKEQIQFSIGPYQILESIGKGGMGEVFLAYDTTCGRRIALKRIRDDLVEHKNIQNRFLKEARITSQLTHPAIIPIYAIEGSNGLTYYTMPFVEGKTLKQILISARQREKQGLKPDHQETIPALMRIFLSVCQAIAYAHSKGIIHRDLKPNNFIVGRYGEVLILDWGLAKLATLPEDPLEMDPIDDHKATPADQTRLGRIVGTVAYLAPERAHGRPASFQTDIYSLGVTLYQILTLHHPFNRQNIQEFRKNIDKEVIIDPESLAPYRDVPPQLSKIVLKCLSPSTQERYQTMDALIHDLVSYLEGRSEWFPTATLNLNHKEDWEFQENVLISEHMAISQGPESSNWFLLMISKDSFLGNTRIETRVQIGEKGHGIGLLLNIPEPSARDSPNSGFCLWIASDLHKNTKLLRATVEVLANPDVYLERDFWYDVAIEKIDNSIHFYINGLLQFSYISHLPLHGTHVGLLAQDLNFSLEEIKIYSGSQNINVNCLAIPEAFLSHKNYAIALKEYRRIGHAFPGTAEAREAFFSAGLTLLEEAKNTPPSKRKAKCDEALEEFGKLRNTTGAPLEYLGKALVYQYMNEYEEEVKCFELAHRRYPNHPLLTVLQEQLVYRLLDSSKHDRKATYGFALLALRHYPQAVATHNVRKLFFSLKKHWETPYFIIESSDLDSFHDMLFAIQLAFWIDRPYVISEMINELVSKPSKDNMALSNALFALMEMEEWDLATKKFQQIKAQSGDPSLSFIETALNLHFHGVSCDFLPKLPKQLDAESLRLIYFFMEECLRQKQPAKIIEGYHLLKNFSLSPQEKEMLSYYVIWAYLLQQNWAAAGNLLKEFSIQENSPFYFLYGCWLLATSAEKNAKKHFLSVLDVPHPKSWTLFNHFYKRKPEEQGQLLEKSFTWEKKKLKRQLQLFHFILSLT